MDDPFVNCCITHSLNGVNGSVEENNTEEAGHLAQLLPCARRRAHDQHCLHGLNATALFTHVKFNLRGVVV